PALAPTVGTFYPTDGTGNPQLAVNPALNSSDFAGLNLSGIRGLYNGSAGGGGFDLSWARDGDGNPVDLASVDYVRIDVLSGRTQIDAVAPVPEPAGWALSLLVAALIWLNLRRRARRTARIQPSANPARAFARGSAAALARAEGAAAAG